MLIKPLFILELIVPEETRSSNIMSSYCLRVRVLFWVVSGFPFVAKVFSECHILFYR